MICYKKKGFPPFFSKMVSLISKSEFSNLISRLIKGSKIILIASDEYKISLDFRDMLDQKS